MLNYKETRSGNLEVEKVALLDLDYSLEPECEKLPECQNRERHVAQFRGSHREIGSVKLLMYFRANCR